ncbi:MAG TPA: hypothetical protein VMP01_06865 [Pirellulaceae bacterium]|nr:hypothetical protein [Pirellulaceae bacterium]
MTTCTLPAKIAIESIDAALTALVARLECCGYEPVPAMNWQDVLEQLRAEGHGAAAGMKHGSRRQAARGQLHNYRPWELAYEPST